MEGPRGKGLESRNPPPELRTSNRMLAIILALMLGVAKLPALQMQTLHRRSPYVGAIALDASSQRMLFADNASRECYPASCTKLMTARILLKEVASGRFRLDDTIVQSKRSAQEEPSKIDLAVGERMTIDNALKALMVKSANDVAVMIAEAVSGSVEAFVERMNAEAAALGKKVVVFAIGGLRESRRKTSTDPRLKTSRNSQSRSCASSRSSSNTRASPTRAYRAVEVRCWPFRITTTLSSSRE